MAKVKASKSPTLSKHTVPDGWVKELNFFDMTGEKAKTKGTSNKFYHIELQIDDSKCEIFTQYGPTGTSNPTNDWRYFDTDRASAEKEFDKLVKSKVKKGYVEIDVAQRALGSEEAKKQTKVVKLINAKDITKDTAVSKLDDGQRAIVSLFFNAQDEFVAQTLKCPLGQLTNAQIDKGRDALDEAKKIVNKKKTLSSDMVQEIDSLTNTFYGLIPHNLGSGARGQMTHLRLDTLDKIVGKEQDLDTLLDAKQVNAILKKDSSVDAKYNSLNCDFEMLDSNDPLFKFLSDYFIQTKVKGHGYDRERVTKIWKMKRKDAKEAAFLNNAERIAGERKDGKHTFATATSRLSGGKSNLWVPGKRPDLSRAQTTLYNKANVWLSWHGTRSANLVGITRRGLLVRPTGAVHTGSLYGDGKYFAWQSTKSLNYCDGGYWTGGRGSNKKYMFLMDTVFGNMHLASGGYFYKNAPRGCHSVYAKANRSGVRNDEMITYDIQDQDNQSSIRYLLEIV